MTKVAIYARYSTDKQDEMSCTRQINSCKEYAKGKKWNIAGEYMDEGVTGFSAIEERPGGAALMEASARGDIDAIIVEDQDRLCRDWRIFPAVVALKERGQKLYDKTGNDITESLMMMYVKAGMSAEMLAQIKYRTYGALKERHNAGFSAGGKSYGYTSYKENPKDPKSKYYKKIIPKEAKVVVEIFELYRDGWSPKRIAIDLNRRKVPSPGSNWKRNGGKTTDGKWRASAINGDPTSGTGILCNPLYNGMYVWGRTKWTKVGTKRTCKVIREKDWKTEDAEHLRIVPPDLWKEVQDRIMLVRKRSSNQRKAGRNTGGRRNAHLLSGILKCASCGRSYTVCDGRRYKCSGANDKLCDNNLAVSKKRIEPLVVDTFRNELLSDDALEVAKAEMRKLLEAEKQRRTDADPREDVKKALASCKNRMARIRKAITLTDDDIEELAEDLITARKEHKELEAKLNVTPKVMNDLPDAVYGGLKYYKKALTNLRTGEGPADAESRALVENLIGEIRVTPYADERALELELGVGAMALPNVLKAGRANAYIVVAGASCQRYLALVAALDIAT